MSSGASVILYTISSAFFSASLKLLYSACVTYFNFLPPIKLFNTASSVSPVPVPSPVAPPPVADKIPSAVMLSPAPTLIPPKVVWLAIGKLYSLGIVGLLVKLS